MVNKGEMEEGMKGGIEGEMDRSKKESCVSIIMPTYNAASFISKAIESVLLQTYKNLELIIIDDASQDDTVSLIEEYKKNDKRIKLLRNSSNSGSGYSRNRGIEAAEGRYISFIDSDDIWQPEKLRIQIEFMQEKSSPFSFTAYDVFRKGKYLRTVAVAEHTDCDRLLEGRHIGCSTVIYDTHATGKQFMIEKRHIREDLALWLNILQKVGRGHGIQESLTIYNIRSKSKSSNKFSTVYRTFNTYRLFMNNDLLRTIYRLSFYALRNLKVRLPYPAKNRRKQIKQTISLGENATPPGPNRGSGKQP